MLWLVGMMGSGKSTIGRGVAATVDRMFIDTDLLIEATTGSSIPALFADEGEARFRRLESRVLEEVADREPPSVVATGGGAVLSEENRNLMRDHGTVVWLSARPATLAARLDTATGRPLLGGVDDPETELARILRRRAGCYEAAAHLTVVVDDRAPSDIEEEVVARWIGI